MDKLSPSEHLHQEFISKGGEISLNSCYNCSTCSTICPVALETGGKFNPRTIIQLANFDNEERLIHPDLNTPNVWDCTMCELCEEECPQHVNLHETFILVKNAAAKSMNIPESYLSEITQVYIHGKAVPLQAAIKKRRELLELPESIDVDIKEIQTLMNLTPANSIIAARKKIKEELISEARSIMDDK